MAEVLKPDLCVIGGGAGGLAVVEAARRYGANVVLVEPGRLGGGRLQSGSVPSKALAAAGRHAHGIRQAALYGIAAEEPKVQFGRLHDHVTGVIEALAPKDSAQRLEALGVAIVPAPGAFLDRKTVKAGDTLIRARRFVVATGSRPRIPELPGLDTIPYFTTDSIFENGRKLTHLVVIGGDPAGLEIGQAYRRLGCDVTVVDPGVALSRSDPELADIALRRMQDEGLVLHQNAAALAVQQRTLGIGVTIKRGDIEEVLDASHVLIANGRTANLESLDLAKGGLRLDKVNPGALWVRKSLRTSNRRVLAIGDATGGPQFVHLAARQAEIVVRNALLGAPGRMPAEEIPYATFIDPEIAEVGLTEAMARQRLGTRYRVARWPFSELDRARTARQTYGVAKMVADRNGRILGAGVVGENAGELIALFALAIANGMTTRALADFVAPYPTISEVASRLAAEFHRDEPGGQRFRRLLAFNRLLP